MKHKTRLSLFGIGCMVLFSLLLIAILELTPKGSIASATVNAEAQAEIEEDGVIVTLRAESSAYRGIQREVEDKIRDCIAVASIESLTGLSDNYLNPDGSLNTEAAPTLAAQYAERPFIQILHVDLQESGREAVEWAIGALEQLLEVQDADFNYILQEQGAWIPSDPYYSSQWNMKAGTGIDAEDAWEITRGSPNVRVGVIDSGIFLHDDLTANLIDGYDFYNDNNVTSDDLGGHGTHVAGIIGADDNTTGVVGIAPDTTLVPLQIAKESSGTTSTDIVIKAINHATQQWENASSRISILNYSYSNYGYNTEIAATVSNYPGLFVWSAGNSGVNLDTFSAIESFDLPNLISVGAIDKNNERSIWTNQYGEVIGSSNYGNHVNIYAPGGEGYISSDNIPTTDNNKNGINYFQGASAATPHVAGVAALMLAVNPDLTASKLKEIILTSADTITISTPDGNQTVKKLNAYTAVCRAGTSGTFFAGGTGGQEDPYIIKTEQQFRNIQYAFQTYYVPYEGNRRYITYFFRLDSDITLSGNWSPFTYRFDGSLDGNGHSITYTMMLTQGVVTASKYHGLFHFLHGRVKNLTLKNCKITSEENTQIIGDSTEIGILAGTIYGTYIESVKIVNPTIICNISDPYVGGIAGGIQSTHVTNCEITGGLLKSYTGYLGGMAGVTSDEMYFSGGKVSTTLAKRYDMSRVNYLAGNLTQTSDVDIRGAQIFNF